MSPAWARCDGARRLLTCLVNGVNGICPHGRCCVPRPHARQSWPEPSQPISHTLSNICLAVMTLRHCRPGPYSLGWKAPQPIANLLDQLSATLASHRGQSRVAKAFILPHTGLKPVAGSTAGSCSCKHHQ